MTTPRTCATCEHDGCCDHYCGGAHWREATPDDDEDAKRDDCDPWDGYDAQDAMEERAAGYQAMMDRIW